VVLMLPLWVVVPLLVIVILVLIIRLGSRDASLGSGPEQATLYREWLDAKGETKRLRAATDARRAKPAPAPTDTIEQVRRLPELRDSGALTEDEFAAKKRDLLEHTS
jgi:putative oligomerization/nucleic acid binding protein